MESMPGGVRLQAAAVRDSARVWLMRRSVVSTSRAEGEGLLRPRVKCVEERDEARDLGEALVRGFSSTPDNSRPMPSKYRPSASRRSAVVRGAKARRRDVVQLEAAAPASVQAAARDHYPSAVPFRQRFKTPERASDEDGAGVVSRRKRRRGARALELVRRPHRAHPESQAASQLGFAAVWPSTTRRRPTLARLRLSPPISLNLARELSARHPHFRP